MKKKILPRTDMDGVEMYNFLRKKGYKKEDLENIPPESLQIAKKENFEGTPLFGLGVEAQKVYNRRRKIKFAMVVLVFILAAIAIYYILK